MRLAIALTLAGCTSPAPSVRAPAASEDTAVAPALDTATTSVVTTPPTPAPSGPPLYAPDRTHSPITSHVVEGFAAITSVDPSLQPDVFMKVGDSMTADANALACFAGAAVDLGDRGDLADTLAWFLAGDAAGSTPFDRETEAALVGVSANWPLAGDPPPWQIEADALQPRFAVVQYGTNDLQLGTTYESALWGFGANLQALADVLLEVGVIPVLLTIPPRTDLVDAHWWVPTYNAVIRGVAQARGLPLIDLHRELAELAGFGLTGDGVHLASASDGACALTDVGLQHGQNVRNLLILDALDRARRASDGEVLDDAAPQLAGVGSPEDPFAVPFLPFTHAADTSLATSDRLDVYAGCDADQDESGPELVYALELAERAAVRIALFADDGVDVDLHLLDGAVEEGACLERDHRIVEATLDPGLWYVVVDSFVADGAELSGEYLLVITPCDADDPACW